MAKTIPPQLGADSFSCPYCGAIAHQTWFKLFAINYKDIDRPMALVYENNLKKTDLRKIEDEGDRQRAEQVLEQLKDQVIVIQRHRIGRDSNWEMVNLNMSRCYSCGKFAVWVLDGLVYPVSTSEVIPHEEMPGPIRQDFDEAVAIVDRSPRGAAALLRLCIQKVAIELGEKGNNLNSDIAALVDKGLNPKIQQALDLVRVVGNNAVHPGQIDLKDDKATALKLFTLVNVIVESMIAAPKHIKEMYETVIPEEVRKHIEKRDS